MRDGYICVAAATPGIRVADCGYNADRILECMCSAYGLGARVLVLPELCITGYTCGDLFLQEPLLDAAERALAQLCEASRDLDLLAVVGIPLRYHGKLYNCAAVLHNGTILGIVPKHNIPNYGEFYELRQFSPWQDAMPQGELALNGKAVPIGAGLLFHCATMPGLIIGVEICEDLWVPQPPSTRMAQAGATLILNLSASNETVGKDAYRRQLLQSHSARLCCAYAYADAGRGESSTDLVFSGHNLLAENGMLLAESAPFAEDTLAISQIDLQRLQHERRRQNTFAMDPQGSAGYTALHFSLAVSDTILTRAISPTPFIPEDAAERSARAETILRIQAEGLRKRLEHTQSKKAVVGVSGGLDSTLALLVCVRALALLGRPASDIMAVTMPCFGTTSRTRNNAVALCACLDIPCITVDITRAVLQHFADIGQPDDTYDAAYENAQARERTQVLMDMANQQNGLVIGTGDLSELALGWATYNGDHMSMYGVNGAVPKTLIRHIVRHAADTAQDASLRAVLLDILDTPVSPELLPAKDGEISQKTEQLVGPYALHDFFLYHMLRWGASPEKLRRIAQYVFGDSYTTEEIAYWLQVFLRRFFSQQFKRSCMPDGPKVGSVSLSPRGDWRMPSDAVNTAWNMDEFGRN